MTAVLIILSDLEMGGSQKKFINVANQLLKHGHDVHMLVLGPPYTLLHHINPKLPFLDLKRAGRFEWRLINDISRYVEKHGINEVCVVGAYPLIYVVPALRFNRKRPRLSLALNSTYFRDTKERLQMCLYIPLMQFMDCIIFGCTFQKHHWKSHYLVGRKKSVVIYNGIDTTYYSTGAIGNAVEEVSARCGFAYSDTVIGSVGKFRPEKGYDHLIEAVDILEKRGVTVKILLVGAGIQEEYLKNKVLEYGLEKRVIFFGEIDDVRPALAAMDVFVLSSVAVETFSNAALEAMAMSRPVVLSRLSGAPEMIEEGIQGLLYQKTDSAELAICIEQLVDRKKCNMMGLAARKHVIEHFSFDRMVTDYESCFGLL